MKKMDKDSVKKEIKKTEEKIIEKAMNNLSDKIESELLKNNIINKVNIKRDGKFPVGIEIHLKEIEGVQDSPESIFKKFIHGGILEIENERISIPPHRIDLIIKDIMKETKRKFSQGKFNK